MTDKKPELPRGAQVRKALIRTGGSVQHAMALLQGLRPARRCAPAWTRQNGPTQVGKDPLGPAKGVTENRITRRSAGAQGDLYANEVQTWTLTLLFEIIFGMAGGRKESRFGLSFVLSQNSTRPTLSAI